MSELSITLSEASNPFDVVIKELHDLEASLLLPPHLGQLGAAAHSGATMRATWQSAVGAVGHEVNRMVMVLTLPPPWDSQAVQAVCFSAIESAQLLLSSLQLATHTIDAGGVLDEASVRLCKGLRVERRGEPETPAGAATARALSGRPASTYTRSLSSFTHSLLRLLVSLSQAAKTHLEKAVPAVGVRQGEASRARKSLLTLAGQVGKLVETAANQPSSPVAAVRRQLLLTDHRTLRDSAKDIRADHPVSERGESEPNDAAGAPFSLAQAALPSIDLGVALLRSLSVLVRLGGDAIGFALARKGGGTAHEEGGVPALGTLSLHPQAMSPCLDALASATVALDDSAIDLAAAINDLGEEEDEEGDEDENEVEDGQPPAAAAIESQMSALSSSLSSVHVAVDGLAQEIGALHATGRASLDAAVGDIHARVAALQAGAAAYAAAAMAQAGEQ